MHYTVVLHGFRKQSFHVSAVKVKLLEPCFSVCLGLWLSIGLKGGNQYYDILFHHADFFLKLLIK